MPYPKKQAVAIFLDIRRRQGEAAAKSFAHKHSADMARGKGERPYRARGRRSK